MSLQMSPNIELLAPGGDAEAIKAAIIAGADAVYCGLNTFNARNRLNNLLALFVWRINMNVRYS